MKNLNEVQDDKVFPLQYFLQLQAVLDQMTWGDLIRMLKNVYLQYLEKYTK